MELADEVVAALESEQRRSDASAERRRFLMGRRNNSCRGPADDHREWGDGSQALGRPPTGVPSLIWAMEIHLVSSHSGRIVFLKLPVVDRDVELFREHCCPDPPARRP